MAGLRTLRSFKYYLKFSSYSSYLSENSSITKTIRLKLMREIIATYFEKHTKHIGTLCELLAEFFSFIAGD
jgi:hypothetical protein